MYLIESVNDGSVGYLDLKTLRKFNIRDGEVYKLRGSVVKWSYTVFDRDDEILLLKRVGNDVYIHYGTDLYILKSVEYIRTVYFSEDGLTIVFMLLGVWQGETTLTIRDKDIWMHGRDANVEILNNYTRAMVKRHIALGVSDCMY